MSEDRPAQDPAGADARISALDERLRAARSAEMKRQAVGAPEADANYRLGSRVLSELLGGIGGGALIGWVFDRFAASSPKGLLTMLFLGTVVAFRNIIRISGQKPE
ncbi:MAG: AtpZ/AtpI family protein [Proteobacteria bacterium]|nr:AtpZ/AtpI family protein [Pseudomonadota bacterium]